jgi:hypothetical protein
MIYQYSASIGTVYSSSYFVNGAPTVTITSTESSVGIEVEVIPDSNDIIAKENLYIVLDTTSNSLLNLIEDPISSGSNKSGNSYVPPSSYTSNKKYTR